jgi:lipopolysaccharide biosynthesis glycosyltransferase
MIERLATAYGVTIDALSVAALGRARARFRVDWGFFSPGHRLSDAAYYRILAMLWLAERQPSERVLYLDSDTCAGPGLADLLVFDLAGRPMAAHLAPTDRALIRRAARKLGVPAGGYFNSGVLLVDLGHPETARGLERTLEIATHSPEKLTYLDQCAFNLAFEGKAARLPDAFNFFVRPEWEMAPAAQEAPVIHYFGHPKPWDPAYGNANNGRWLREFAALGEVLTLAETRLLVALALGLKDLDDGSAP